VFENAPTLEARAPTQIPRKRVPADRHPQTPAEDTQGAGNAPNQFVGISDNLVVVFGLLALHEPVKANEAPLPQLEV
jgi:hypothetical protein